MTVVVLAVVVTAAATAVVHHHHQQQKEWKHMEIFKDFDREIYVTGLKLISFDLCVVFR